MEAVLSGVLLGVAVSASPGPNTVACVKLAATGFRRAIPIIVAAALTDAAYSLLSASGVIVANELTSHLMAYATPVALLIAAALAMPRAGAASRFQTIVPLINPATAALWIGLSSLPALQAMTTSAIALRAIAVAAGTSAWFLAVATAAGALGPRMDTRTTARTQTAFAAGLVCLSVASLVQLH